MNKFFNKGLKEEDKKEGLLKRLKNIEDKKEGLIKRLKNIEDKSEAQLKAKKSKIGNIK